MANPEHVEILEQGVEAWNVWRRQNLRVVPALRGAALGGRDLRGANLLSADLRGADLSDVDLSRSLDPALAGPWEGEGKGRSSLQAALLRNSNLTGANFSGAKLYETDLTSARIDSCILDGDWLGGTKFCDVDLRTTSVEALTFGYSCLVDRRALE